MAGDRKAEQEAAARLYRSGMSIPDVAADLGLSLSTARKRIIDSGEPMRDRADGVRMAGHKISNAHKGKKKPPFGKEWCENISRGRRAWADQNAAGVSKKSNGYIQVTRGKHKHRGVHVVKMEERLGRALLPDEHVHHIDGDRSNNDDNNLALVTISGHARLHRFEDKLQGKERERKSNGRFR
jgi:hypothetical protein